MLLNDEHSVTSFCAQFVIQEQYFPRGAFELINSIKCPLEVITYTALSMVLAYVHSLVAFEFVNSMLAQCVADLPSLCVFDLFTFCKGRLFL